MIRVMTSTEHILSLLTEERAKLDAAIAALRGIPKATAVTAEESMPDWVKPAAKKEPGKKEPVKKKRGLSAAGRKAIADAAKKRWAAIREAKSVSPVVLKPEPEAAPKAPAKKVATRKKKAWTPAMKKAHTARMKAFWAARRKAAK
jgi:hypothetical protein